MPKRYGIKDRDVAASWVMERLFDGRLRSGDRLDRREIADAVGISRVPVQEMLAQLERDGIVRSEYHRGAYVERFDESVIRETYELYGLLIGRASAAAAVDAGAELVETIRALTVAMRQAGSDPEFADATWEFRRVINSLYAGPKLRALVSTFGTFMPTAFRIVLGTGRTQIFEHYLDEFTAISTRDPDGCRAVAAARARDEAEIVVSTLTARQVFEALPAEAPKPD